MRILVCGGRKFNDPVIVNATLDAVHATKGIDVLIQGGADGADWLARMWAKNNNIRCEQYHAEWAKHGKAAGPIRNQQMIDEGKPDLFVAFPGGKGTADMVKRLKAAGISGSIMK